MTLLVIYLIISFYLYDLLDDPATKEYNEFRRNIIKKDVMRKDKKHQ